MLASDCAEAASCGDRPQVLLQLERSSKLFFRLLLPPRFAEKRTQIMADGSEDGFVVGMPRESRHEHFHKGTGLGVGFLGFRGTAFAVP